MPNVYTRTGDRGLTGLFGGSRVPKQDPAVEAYGTVDEANAAIGEAKAVATDPESRAQLHQIQQRLFVLAAELASDARGREILDNLITDVDVTALEALIDGCLAVTGPQRAFVVPGRDLPSASLHRARTITRRAERRLLKLAEVAPVRAELITYLNRLSDTLYALARLAEHRFDLGRIEQLVRAAVHRALAQDAGAITPAGGYALTTFDLATLTQLSAAAQARAGELGVPIVFAGVDAGGNLVLLHRMAGSLLGSLDIAINKAFTSAAFQLPTAALKNPSTPEGELHGIQNSNNGRVVVFGGGLPIFVEGVLSGGIGVSGGTVEEDIDIVSCALRSVQEMRRP